LVHRPGFGRGPKQKADKRGTKAATVRQSPCQTTHKAAASSDTAKKPLLCLLVDFLLLPSYSFTHPTTMENGMSSESKDPATFLTEILGSPVTIKLNSGVIYKGLDIHYYYSSCFRNVQPLIFIVSGELQSVDGYMNIALEKTQEYVHGTYRRDYGDAFIRGNNGNRRLRKFYSKITKTHEQFFTYPRVNKFQRSPWFAIRDPTVTITIRFAIQNDAFALDACIKAQIFSR
jgi:U6 snRNA-associated Sm-like protein LSm6